MFATVFADDRLNSDDLKTAKQQTTLVHPCSKPASRKC